MTDFLIRVAAYLAAGILLVAAFLLLVYGLLRLLPGPAGSSLRRVLFKVCRPWLEAADRWIPLRSAGWDLTALLAAFVLLAVCRFAIPWLVLWGSGPVG